MCSMIKNQVGLIMVVSVGILYNIPNFYSNRNIPTYLGTYEIYQRIFLFKLDTLLALKISIL